MSSADLEAGECDSCGEDVVDDCPSSKRPCGHHCNHSWSHDSCCWCGAEVDEDGNWPHLVVTADERTALVHVLHKVFMDCHHASGPGLPALVDAVIAAGWRPAHNDGDA